jgi:hypothetical protein
MKPFVTVAVPIALRLAFAGLVTVQAQEGVTRQATTEPVETVVTQGPSDTTATRRIVTPTSSYAQAPLPPEALSPDYVESTHTTVIRPPAAAAPAAAAHAVAAPAAATPAARPSRARTVGVATTTATHTVKPSKPVVTRTVTRTVVARPPVPSWAPVALTPADRLLVYRVIAQRAYVPPPVPSYGPPVVPQTETVAGADYPLRTIYPADGYTDYGYRPYGWSTLDYGYGHRDGYAYRWDGVPLVVGARIPPSVPLYAVPELVTTRVPAARPYSYALLGNRVYLVDPATAIIVAEITS